MPGRPIVAVGTTAFAPLEDAALRPRPNQARRNPRAFPAKQTHGLFIVPGFQFRVSARPANKLSFTALDGCLALVCAFRWGVNVSWRPTNICRRAGAYRFYSYGDCSSGFVRELLGIIRSEDALPEMTRERAVRRGGRPLSSIGVHESLLAHSAEDEKHAAWPQKRNFSDLPVFARLAPHLYSGLELTVFPPAFGFGNNLLAFSAPWLWFPSDFSKRLFAGLQFRFSEISRAWAMLMVFLAKRF